MAITSGFFNSVSGDRTYNADDMTRYFEGLVSSGVFANPSGNLQVISRDDIGDMAVSVEPGRGIIDCHWFNNDASYEFTVPAADALLNRIDAIDMCYDIDAREIVLKYKTGEPAANPKQPLYYRTQSQKEYRLARINVNKGVTRITQADITDTRPDKAVCGFITNLVDNVDITSLFLQWQNKLEQQLESFDSYIKLKQSEFDDWFYRMSSTLQVPTTIKKLEVSFTTTASQTDTIPIEIDEFLYGDALLVHLGGMLLREGTDYTVESTSPYYTIKLSSAVGAGRTYTFMVFKPAYL